MQWPQMLWLAVARTQLCRREERTPGNELCRWDEGGGGAKCGGGGGAMGPRGRGPAGPWRQAPLGPRLSSFSVSEGRLRITAGNYRRCSQIPIKNAEEPSLSPGRPGRSRCSGGRGALVARTDGPPRGAVLPGSSPLLNDFLGEKVICPVGGNDSAKKRAIISAQGHCTWKPVT